MSAPQPPPSDRPVGDPPLVDRPRGAVGPVQPTRTPRPGRPAPAYQREVTGGWQWVLGAILVLLALGFIAIFAFDRDLAVTPVAVDVADVGARPAQFINRYVVLDGRVLEVVDRRTFVLGSVTDGRPAAGTAAGTTAGATPVLVVSARPISALSVNAPVQVTGTVQSFDLTTIEGQLGVDLSPATAARWQGRPVVIAEQTVPLAAGR